MTDRLSPALLEIKRQSVTASGEFSGYASTWGGPPDSYGDIIQRGAFTDALAQHKASNTAPAMLWSHDQKEPIGRWQSITEDAHGLLVVGKLTLGTKRGAEAHALLKDSAIALSIGYIVAKSGAKQIGSIRQITKIARLEEVSLVAIPANSSAKVIEVKKPETPRDFEKLLRDAGGFSSREAKRATAAGWRGYVRDERLNDIDTVLRKIDDLQTLIERKNHE